MSVRIPKIEYMLDAILRGKVTSFIIPLSRKKIREAQKKGYTEIKPIEFEQDFPEHEIDYAVAAFKPGTKEYVCIHRIPKINWVHRIITKVNEAVEMLSIIECSEKSSTANLNLFYSAKSLNDTLKNRLGMDGEKNIQSMFSPFYLCITEIKFERVQDADEKQMEREGVRKQNALPFLDEEDERLAKKYAQADGTYYRIPDIGELDDYKNLHPTAKETYRDLIRTYFGHKIWDENEYVLRVSVAAGVKTTSEHKEKDFVSKLILADILGPDIAQDLYEIAEEKDCDYRAVLIDLLETKERCNREAQKPGSDA